MAARRVEVDPVVFDQVFEIDHLEPHFVGKGEDSFLFHDLLGRRGTASLSQSDSCGPPLPDFFHKSLQRVIVGRSGKRVGGVEIGLNEDPLPLHRRRLKQVNGLFYPRSPVKCFDQGDLRFFPFAFRRFSA